MNFHLLCGLDRYLLDLQLPFLAKEAFLSISSANTQCVSQTFKKKRFEALGGKVV